MLYVDRASRKNPKRTKEQYTRVERIIERNDGEMGKKINQIELTGVEVLAFF